MRTLLACVLSLVLIEASVARAQSADSTAVSVDSSAVAPASQPAAAAPPAETASTQKSLRDRVYFGGSVIVSFGDVSRIGVYPMIAYKFTPKLSLGAELGYEYLKYDNIDQSANNYGWSVFGRYRLVPQLYAHAEYQMVNYEIFTTSTTSSRDWVPFFLLGGGISSRVGANTWAYVEVLFDVLNDDNSPYDEGEPVISAGVGVGF